MAATSKTNIFLANDNCFTLKRYLLRTIFILQASINKAGTTFVFNQSRDQSDHKANNFTFDIAD